MDLRGFFSRVSRQDQGLAFGLRMKLLLLIALVIILLSSFITYFYQARIRASFFSIQIRSLESQLEFIGKVGKSLFADISQGRSSIDRFFGDLEKHNPDVRFFVVFSSKGEILYERIPNPSYRSFTGNFSPPREPQNVVGETEIGGEKIVYVAIPVEISVELALAPLDIFLQGGAMAGGEERSKSQYLWILGGASAQRIVDEFYQFRYQLLKYTVPTSLLILLFFYFLLGRMVLPLMKMVKAAREISEGRFGEKVEIVTEDEVGILAHTFNLMVERLGSLFSQLRLSSQSLINVTEKLTQASEEIRQGSLEHSSAFTETTTSLDELDRNINELARTIEELNSSIVDSRTSITEMTSTIREIDEQMEELARRVDSNTRGIHAIIQYFENVKEKISVLQQATQEAASATNQVDKNIQEIRNSNRDVSSLTENVVKLAERGQGYAVGTREGMAEIERRFRGILSAAKNLERRGEEIRKIVETVREIADQTNLLALNAAIIAAQAGESGQQFSVIAKEIKNLSDHSQAEIQEIQDRVEGVTGDTKSLIEMVSQGGKAVEEGQKLAHQTESLLKEIYQLSGRVQEQIVAIARATEEQSQGSHQVNQSVQDIFHMVEEIHRNVVAQEEEIRGIRDTATRMQNISMIVRNSTAENAKGSQRVGMFIEKVAQMAAEVSEGIQEQRKASQKILESAQRIRALSQKNQELVLRFSEAVRVLREEIERFQNLSRLIEEEEKVWQ
jgi:methyl-accepting chemotaxis protein